MKKIIAAVIAVAALSGCSAIQTYEEMPQRQGVTLQTNVGGQVFKVNRSSDLPNAFGKADLYGGKINRGYTELRYLGKRDNLLGFQVIEVQTESNETTMSRYGGQTTVMNSNTSGYAHGRVDAWGNVSMNGSSNTYATATTYNAPQGSTQRLPHNATVFVVDESKAAHMTIAGKIVSVKASDEISITYTIN